MDASWSPKGCEHAAVATVAATAAAGFLIHTSGIVITVSLGGARGLPHPPAVPVLELVSIAAVATVVAGSWVIYRRSNPARHIRIGIASVIRQLVLLARDRPRAMGVIAGTAAASIATVTAFWAAVNAIFAIGFLPAATIYLIGTAISNIAPSPAGVGVPEAALTAGLTITGIPCRRHWPACSSFGWSASGSRHSWARPRGSTSATRNAWP